MAHFDLVVLTHGIDSPLGSDTDMVTIESCLHQLSHILGRSRRAGPLLILNSLANSGRTQDGLVCLGRRLLEELQAFLRAQPTWTDGATVHLSFIGHSLGGLIARSCIGWMESRGLFQSGQFVPVSFVSIATPHLGSRRAGLHHALLRQILQFYWFGPTFYEILLEDHMYCPETDRLLWPELLSPSHLGQQFVRQFGPPIQPDDRHFHAQCRQSRRLPLLWLMAEPDSPFIRGLRRFAHRTLVSSVQLDWQVPYCSSSLTHVNPHSQHPSSVINNRIALLDGFDHDAQTVIFAHLHSLLAPNLLLHPAPPAPVACAAEFSFAACTSSQDFPLHSGLYHPTILAHLLELSWRRLDIALDRLFPHDLLVAKPSIPNYDVELGSHTSQLFAAIVLHDHAVHAREHPDRGFTAASLPHPGVRAKL